MSTDYMPNPVCEFTQYHPELKPTLLFIFLS